MKNLLVTLLMLSSSTVYAYDRCYMLKDVTGNEKEGVSKICYFTELNQCFFTSDQNWIIHTFQVNCKTFHQTETYVEEHPELEIKPIIPKTS